MGLWKDDNASLLKSEKWFICIAIDQFAWSHSQKKKKKLTSKPVNEVLQNVNYYVFLFKDYNFMRERSSLTKPISFCRESQFGWYGNYVDIIHLFLGIVIACWMTFALKSNTLQWIKSWLISCSRCQWKVIISSATVKGIYSSSAAIKNFHESHGHERKIFADKICG